MSQHSQNNDKPNRSFGEQGNLSDNRLVEIHSHLARDKEEPSEGFSMLPIVIVFIFCGFGFWAGVYLTRNSGGFSASSFDLDAPKV
ncbi:MAG: hypothetical protein EBQ49_07850, partial [Verrucomicrobia bacterium]|nr:hypothetical protein [Verrucomicrobiota bacterium]